MVINSKESEIYIHMVWYNDITIYISRTLVYNKKKPTKFSKVCAFKKIRIIAL